MNAAGLEHTDEIIFFDEMRLGRRAQVRRRWGLVGVPLVQKVQLIYDWKYLLLGVDPSFAPL